MLGRLEVGAELIEPQISLLRFGSMTGEAVLAEERSDPRR
jgi:hypothetical protein